MSNECISSRFKKLRNLREKLCDSEKNWKEAFEARDWIVNQLKIIKNMSESDKYTKVDILDRVSDILCIFEPKSEDKNVCK